MYFEIIESTLLVEALRVDYTRLSDQTFCEHCGMVLHNSNNQNQKKAHERANNNINLPARISARSFDPASAYREISFVTTPDDQHKYSDHSIHHNHIPSTTSMTSAV